MSKPHILSTSLIALSRLFRIDALELEFKNGNQAIFECIKTQGHGVVMVAAINGEELIMIKEYAAGFDRYELGFVKGKIDLGETAVQAASRELAEEIGYTPTHLEFLRSVTTSPGYSDFSTSLYIASGLVSSALHGCGDELEPLELVHWPLNQIEKLYDHPEVTDVRSLFMLKVLEQRCGR